jgi:hypothetical protein
MKSFRATILLVIPPLLTPTLQLPFFAQSVAGKQIVTFTLIAQLKERTLSSFPVTISNATVPALLNKNEQLKLYTAEITEISLTKNSICPLTKITYQSLKNWFFW